MANIITTSPRVFTIQNLRHLLTKRWAFMKLHHSKGNVPSKDPRIAQDLQGCARADVDRLLHQAR